MRDPVIICPYVYDDDVATVRRAFHLDEAAGRRLPFFFWKDENLVGPEIAYETCWMQFPERDVIILHTDMTPMPEDSTNRWYEELLDYARSMPNAGMLACNLLYPIKSIDGNWLIQCAGGYFEDGKIQYIGGGVNVAEQVIYGTALPLKQDIQKVRRVGWVTFGGVYVRREVLTACGPFDRRYRWAYVMDVDYSLEARSRGYDLYQVPVNLLHFESRTFKRLGSMTPENVAQLNENYRLFYEKWAGWLRDDPTAGAPQHARTPTNGQ